MKNIKNFEWHFNQDYTCEYNQIVLKELAESEDNGQDYIHTICGFGGTLYDLGEEELEYIKNQHPKKIWSVFEDLYDSEGNYIGDSDNDSFYVLNGFYDSPNVYGYLVTEEECKEDMICYSSYR